MITRTTALIAGGAALAGAAVVGVPALVVAAVNDGPDRTDGSSREWHGDGGRGHHGGFGHGPRGHGPGDGFGGGLRGGVLADADPQGELSDTQAAQLADAAETTKLARDVYTAFADATGDGRFARLAWSEAHQLRALQAMLEVYDATDPTRTAGPGEFQDEALASEYDALVEEGSGSVDDAVTVAVELETQRADELDAAAEDVEDAAPDVHRLYEHLALAADRHRDRLED